MIYSSNLCTEIMQNMKEILDVEDKILQIDGEDHVVTDVKAGDFVVCNLASLVLGNIDLKNDEEMEFVVSTMIRALDNVIDLNYYPTPFAKITNAKYRDRKSTRLNSSHGSISYAVFCLKKKKEEAEQSKCF